MKSAVKEYTKPSMEISAFNIENVITASSASPVNPDEVSPEPDLELGFDFN